MGSLCRWGSVAIILPDLHNDPIVYLKGINFRVN